MDDRENKNAVFDTFTGIKGLQTESRDAAIMKEFGLDIPTSLVPIPSEGKVYSSDHPLHNTSEVEIRGMTTREEDLLMSRALIRKGTVITELIKSCMVTPGVDVQQLISGDRNALMVAIRILGYGAAYEASMECPSCQAKNEINFDLNQLEIKPLDLTPVVPGENRFEFVLPKTKAKVEFRFLTGKDEEEILAVMESRKKKGIQIDNAITMRLQHSILSVNGIADKNKITKFISIMPAIDSNTLRQYIDEHEPKIDMTYSFECQQCEHQEDTVLPLGPTFFWPNARRSRNADS
jgi:hypothetical protein